MWLSQGWQLLASPFACSYSAYDARSECPVFLMTVHLVSQSCCCVVVKVRQFCSGSFRVATVAHFWKTWNTPEFLWTWKTQGFLREFCATSGKNCNRQSIFSSTFKYLVRVRWWPVILLELMWNDAWWRSLLHLLFVAITYGKVSLWLWKSLENSGNFSPTLWPPCHCENKSLCLCNAVWWEFLWDAFSHFYDFTLYCSLWSWAVLLVRSPPWARLSTWCQLMPNASWNSLHISVWSCRRRSRWAFASIFYGWCLGRQFLLVSELWCLWFPSMRLLLNKLVHIRSDCVIHISSRSQSQSSDLVTLLHPPVQSRLRITNHSFRHTAPQL